MKLRIEGKIVDRGHGASFDERIENFEIGKRIGLGNADNALVIDKVEGRRIVLRFIRFETVDTLTLRIGESYEFHTEGNAYEFGVRLSLGE